MPKFRTFPDVTLLVIPLRYASQKDEEYEPKNVPVTVVTSCYEYYKHGTPTSVLPQFPSEISNLQSFLLLLVFEQEIPAQSYQPGNP